MRSLFISFWMVLLSGAAVLCDSSSVGYLISPLQRFDPVSPAGNLTSGAVITAPATLIFDNRPELMFGHFSTNGSFEEDQVLCIRTKQLGFGTESIHFEGEEGMRRYTLALSTRYGARSALGLSYTLHSSGDKDLRDLSSLDIGLALRAGGSFDFLFTARNLGRTRFRGERIDRFYEAGFQASLMRGRIGFFMHGRLAEGDTVEEGNLYAGGHLFASRSLLLSGRIDEERDVVTGAEVLFTQFAVGFNYFTGDDGEGGFSYFRMFALR